MGNLQTLTNQNYQDSPNNHIKINLDFKKPINVQLKPLTNWSLKQIRQIYAAFRKRKGSPLLNRSQFYRFLRISRIMSFYIYDIMCKKDIMNIFDLMAVLVLTSYTNHSNKVQFLFNIFDLDSSRGLQFKQLILAFKSVIRGYSIITDQQIPSIQTLQRYSQIMFSKADLNNDQCLQLGQVLAWFQSNVQGLYLFKRFQPQLYGKQEYYIFNPFFPYTETQIKIIEQRICKQYQKKLFVNEDFCILSNFSAKLKQTESSFVTQTNLAKLSLNQTPTSKLIKNTTTFNNKSKNFFFNINLNSQNSKEYPKGQIQLSEKANYQINLRDTNKQNQFSDIRDTRKNKKTSTNYQDFNTMRESKNIKKYSLANSSTYRDTRRNIRQNLNNSTMKSTGSNLKSTGSNLNCSTFRSGTKKKMTHDTILNLSHFNGVKDQLKKKRFNNIIIIKGRSITKKQIHDLREYFDGLSLGKKYILIQDYMQAFSQDKYNHMKSIAASLFNFLDKKQNGRVTFNQLVQKLYPDMSKSHMEIVKFWIHEYNQNFNLQKKIQANRQHEQLKKRILPKNCLNRYNQIFNFFDKGKKGYIDVEDLKRVLGDVSTQKQIIQTFQQNDKDNDGKLTIKQFLHVLLPLDLQIQGL